MDESYTSESSSAAYLRNRLFIQSRINGLRTNPLLYSRIYIHTNTWLVHKYTYVQLYTLFGYMGKQEDRLPEPRVQHAGFRRSVEPWHMFLINGKFSQPRSSNAGYLFVKQKSRFSRCCYRKHLNLAKKKKQTECHSISLHAEKIISQITMAHSSLVSCRLPKGF